MRPKAMRCGAVLSLAVLLLTACDGGSGASGEGLPSPGTAVGGSESPTATPAATAENDATKLEKYADVPTDLSLSEKEKVAAREALVMVDDYYAYYFKVAQDGGEGSGRFKDYAADSALIDAEASAKSQRNKKTQVEGGYILRDQVVNGVDLDLADDTSLPFVKLSACIDIRDALLLDSKGNVITSDDRPDSSIHNFVLAEYDDGWRVSSLDIPGVEC